MTSRERHPFPYVADSACRTLILGSFPSVKSRESGFYYGHPQNRFWRLLAAALCAPVPSSVSDKRALLLTNHIALWDAALCCDVSASSDSSLRRVEPTDLGELLALCPIDLVLCNGSAAYDIYMKHQYMTTGLDAARLPSTSPANAAYTFDRLLSEWKPYLVRQCPRG